MARIGDFSRFLAVVASVLMVIPAAAFAEDDDVGWPYRGPQELRGGSGDSEDEESGDSGDGNEDPNENPNENPNETPDGGSSNPSVGGPGQGKKATIVGDILWSWWWEHNKDRFLARATERGRINAGSTLYWFGSGAKFPPRDITPVSSSQKRDIYNVLAKRLEDKTLAVRKAACIALGRVGVVPANEEEAKASAANDKISDNMCARALLGVVRSAKDPDLRNHAILGLGLTGDAKGIQALLAMYDNLATENRPNALIAFGLARAPEAIEKLVGALPKSAKSPTESELAAIHALGLYGPEFTAEIEKIKYGKGNGIQHLEDLAGSKSGAAQVPEQAVTALARLHAGLKVVAKGVRHKSPPVKNASILALAEYSGDEKSAASAWKALKSGYKGSQQTKNFVLLTSGDLAGRLDENSKTRAAILKWLHDKKQLGSNDNYTRACSVIAVAVARDATAEPEIAALLQSTTIDHYVAGACSVALGLLRAADRAKLVLDRVVNGKFNADAKGYGMIGLALMGDTTRIEAVMEAARKNTQKEAQRQAPLAVGVLGDRRQSKTLANYFSKKWKQNERYAVSNAAFGLGWIRDAESVDNLLKLASTSPDFEVRAMATIALGYVGALERVTGLTRCFAGANYKKKFNSFKTLAHISRIL